MNWINNILTEMGFKPHPSNWKHFAAGAVIALAVFMFIHYELDWSVWPSLWVGVGSASVIGLAKEIKDSAGASGFDGLDLIMTILGGVAGAVIGFSTTAFL